MRQFGQVEQNRREKRGDLQRFKPPTVARERGMGFKKNLCEKERMAWMGGGGEMAKNGTLPHITEQVTRGNRGGG